MGLVISTAAIQEPVTLEDLISQVRVVDKRDYARLSSMGVAAREWCESYLGQQLAIATYKWTFDRFVNQYIYQSGLYSQQVWPWQFYSQSLIGNRLPGSQWMLWPPRNPVRSVTSIYYINLNGQNTLLPSNQYIVDTKSTQCRIAPAYACYWPASLLQIDAIEVTFVAGYTQVPNAVRLAICMLASAWFDQREAVTYDNPTVVPMGVKTLLDSAATGRYVL